MATSKKKLAPPPPVGLDGRDVDVPPTVRAKDTTRGDDIPLGKTRADFREGEFTRALRQHGKYCIWRKAVRCPCETEETNQAVVDCEHCNSSGWLWIQPLQIQAHMVQFDKKMSLYEKMGIWQEGTINITVEAKHRLGYYDSLEMQDAVIPFNEVIEKGNRRGIRRSLKDGVDAARFRIRNVAAALYEKKDGSLFFLQEGFHFNITEEGWLKWTSTGEAQVPDGTRISLHYDYCPVLLVLSWMHISRTDLNARKKALPTVIDLPQQAGAKLDFLIDVSSVPSLALTGQPTGVANPKREPRFG